MPQIYTSEFKKKIVRLREEEGRTYKSLTAEFGVSKATISKWCRELREECQKQAKEKALEIINSQLTEELKSYISSNYGDIQIWLSNKIESVIYMLKTTNKIAVNSAEK